MHAAESPVEIPRLAVADVFVENQRLILRKDADRIDSRIDTVGQREIDDTILGAEGDAGFAMLLVSAKSRLALAAARSMATHSFFLRIG